MKTVMAKAVSQDSDGDGLIDNSGFADQTYDAWIVSGPRYCIPVDSDSFWAV